MMMFRKTKIIVSGKGHRRRKLGPIARRIRAIAIVTVVVSFVAWSTGSMSNRRRVRQAQIDISRIAHAARLFRADFSRCPQNVEELVSPPEGAPYLRALKDPWGKQYILHCPSMLDDADVDVRSFGPDGEMSGDDDVKNYLVELNLTR